MIKKSLLWFLVLPAMACSRVAAAAADPAMPWVSPVARAIIERTRTAYAALEGWTATVEFEGHATKGGVETVQTMRRTERFLNDGSATGSYASISIVQAEDRPWLVSVQDSDGRYTLGRGQKGELEGALDLPTETPWHWSGPHVRVELETALYGATYVSYSGVERVSGKRCDVIEVLNFALKSNAPGEPSKISGISSRRFYVDPEGFVVRSMMRTDSLAASPKDPDRAERWNEVRVTHYDAKAKLTAADFSREAFERDAQTMLKEGESLPELARMEFRRGERLPDMRFIAWADKQPFRVSDLQGKVVVVETWASWCHFCKEAFPFYEKMRQQLAAQGVVFVAVSFDAKVADYEKWMNAHGSEYGFKFGLVDTPDVKAALKEFRGSLPAFYVLGRDGRILSSYGGFAYGAGNEDPRLLAALREAGIKF